MKGVLLAGGTGSRLRPLTQWTNKHLLPVYDEPMIFRPLKTLTESGITEILIVTGPEYSGEFVRRLGSGSQFGVQFTYLVQESPRGIADGLLLAEHFAEGEPLFVILGDNFFAQHDEIARQARIFRSGAEIFITKSQNPTQYGVVFLDNHENIEKIIEKPAQSTSPWVQTGAYLYDQTVFEKIKGLSPSARGELEISDVNALYLDEKNITATKINGDWFDCGTHKDLLKASQAFASQKNPKMPSGEEKSAKKEAKPRVTVGIVTWNSEKHLKTMLESLKTCHWTEKEVIVWDNASADDTRSILATYKEDLGLTIIPSAENIGFGAAHNMILRQTSAPYYFCLNPDTLLQPSTIESLVKEAKARKMVGCLCPKIKRLEKGNQTNYIDSVGVKMRENFAAYDRKSGQIDTGQAENAKEVFGFTGAAAFFRREALEDVAHRYKGRKEFFDEAFFAYKEDVELSLRLRYAGWKIFYTPKSVLFHHRTARQQTTQKKRFRVLAQAWARISAKKKSLNALGYRNQRLLIQKYLPRHQNFRIPFKTWIHQAQVFLFLLIFETETLLQWFHIIKKRKEVRTKALQVKKCVPVEEIESWMEA